MGKILGGYLFPHPPIIVGEIGRGEEREASKTLAGSQALARDIGQVQPSTIILITPHGPLFRDAIAISMEEELEGDFRNFGRPSLGLKFKNNRELVKRIGAEAGKEGISLLKVDRDTAEAYNIDLNLDHGTLVPLYFVDQEYRDYKLVHITYGLLTPEVLYRFGQIIQGLVKESDEEAIMIASGDLSHKLSHSGPYGYSHYGGKYDKKIVGILEGGDLRSLVDFDLDLCEKAGECALRSLLVLAGFLDKFSLESKVLSYEGPFGVGYSNAYFKIREESPYVKLAKDSLEHYIRTGQVLAIGEDLPGKLGDRYGAFVTIKIAGQLRGCIGTIGPSRANLAEEIVYNAMASGTEDPRFPPVREEELGKLEYSVDILYPPEPIDSIEELDVEKYGLIVAKDFRKGLLLPNLEGVDRVEDQVAIALNKAGIGEHEDYKMERFQVDRHI